MESLAAVGLAGNIVQFIDFGCKLFEQTTSIYHSRAGSAAGARSLESLTNDLQSVSSNLAQGLQQNGGHNGQTGMQKLAHECQDAASVLLSVLHGLRAKKPGSKWESFRAALATTWKQDDISVMERRLDSYRSQLILHLEILQDTKSSAFLLLMQELNNKTQNMNTSLANQIAGLKSDVQDALVSLQSTLAAQKKAKDAAKEADDDIDPTERDDAAGHIAAAAAASDAWARVSKLSTRSTNVPSLARTLLDGESNGATMVVALSILECLTFPQMDFRHSKVHEAHPKTFTEVFEAKILPWLRSSEPIFWVSGKPGSGKSTLMKYIVNNPKMRHELQRSMHGKVPRVASYFFWINGTDLQRSQEGLLRSLLYELLCQSPELIVDALPDIWQSTSMLIHQSRPISEMTWKRADLLAAIERLSSSRATAERLCVFVDGLDEYEGDHDNLIGTIQHLRKLGLKMCLASRPWNVFEEAFGLNITCKLYLQDLNKADIKLYVNDKLLNRHEFAKMRSVSPGNNELIRQLTDEVVEKSQGVFLWVFLVVRSLIDGLRNHDRLSQLQKRLRQFPGDLQQFFNHIFQSMDPVYHAQTAQMFQVALQVTKPPSPLLYWYLDELEDRPELALNMDVSTVDATELVERVDSSRRRINGRCKGLLEVTATKNSDENSHTQDYYVDFLHRTVKDFLMTTEIRRVFVSWQPEDFDADFAICQSSLAEFKSGVNNKAQARGALHNFLYSAKQLELKHGETPTHYLHELERAGELCRSQRGLSSEYPWRLLGVTCFVEVVISADLLLFAKTRSLEFPQLFGIPNSRSAHLFEITNVSLDMVRLTLSMTSSLLGELVPISLAMMDCLINALSSGDKPYHESLELLTMMSGYASFDTTILPPRLQDDVNMAIARQIEESGVVKGRTTLSGLAEVEPARKPVVGMGISRHALDAGPGTMVDALRAATQRSHGNASPSLCNATTGSAQNATTGRSRLGLDAAHDPSNHQAVRPIHGSNSKHTNALAHHSPHDRRTGPTCGSNESRTYPEQLTRKQGFFRGLRNKIFR